MESRDVLERNPFYQETDSVEQMEASDYGRAFFTNPLHGLPAASTLILPHKGKMQRRPTEKVRSFP